MLNDFSAKIIEKEHSFTDIKISNRKISNYYLSR